MVVAIEVDLQLAGEWDGVPGAPEFTAWVQAALAGRETAELTIRIVGREESRALNDGYRGKDAATNVLSFPADLPDGLGIPLLGDVVICAPVVAEEAGAQGKPLQDHWAHLTVHGVLHLLGYDHREDAEAEEMESLEVEILASLGVPNPYV